MSKDQKPLHSGELGIIRKDRVDWRFFVLWTDRLDFYLNASDFKNDPKKKKGRLAICDVEELGTLDEGFVLTLEGGKNLTVQCDAKSLNAWIGNITSLMDIDGDDDEEDGNNQIQHQTAGDMKKDDRALTAGTEAKKDHNLREDRMQNAVPGNEKPREDDDEEEEVEVRLDADLQLEVNGKLEQRYVWLTPHSLECFKDRSAAEKEAPLSGFALADIGQVDISAGTGFSVTSKDKKQKMVLVCDEPTRRLWIMELREAMGTRKGGQGQALVAKTEQTAAQLAKGVGIKGDGQEAVEVMEVEVILDEALEIELNGKAMKKHVWLTTTSFDCTETSDENSDAIVSFGIQEISVVQGTASGFILRHKDGRQKIVIICGPSTSEKWTNGLQSVGVKVEGNAVDTREGEELPMAGGSDASTGGAKAAAALSLPAESPQRQNEARTMTTPALSNQVQAFNPLPGSTVKSPPGYPGAKYADELDTTPPQAQSIVQTDVCKGTLGIFQRGREEKRYFVLFRDSFKYWIDETSYLRGDNPRGHVLHEQIVNVKPTDPGFALSFEGGNQITLVCGSERKKQLWLDEWRKILGSIVTSAPEGKELEASYSERDQKQVPETPPTFAAQPDNDKSPLADSTSVITRSQIIPGAVVDIIGKDLLFEGNLLLVRKVKRETRYFALFKDRLDYFGTAFDMRSGKNPRGRVWFRDMSSVKVEGCNFTVCLENINLPSLVLVSDPNDSQSWLAAWTKSGVICGWPSSPEQKASRSVAPSLARSNLQKSPPSSLQEPMIHGAIIEGRFQITRGKAGGGPSIRHVVLFQDRLDYFSDAVMARRGGALESFQTKDIQWIDVVDGGFEITVASHAYKLRELQGLLPQWIDALLRVFQLR